MNDLATKSDSPATNPPTASARLGRELERLFEDLMNPGRGIFNFASRLVGPMPAMDLVDGGAEYRLSAELPGLTRDDVTVEFADGTLTLAGEKSEKHESDEGGCLMSERRYGSFERRFTLPNDADPDAIDAEVKDGVLTVSIGKREAAASGKRRIEIKG